MIAGPPLPADLWDSLPPEARALILALRAEVAELHAKVQALQVQTQELRDRLHQDSTNSSQPHSTDPPTVKPRPPRRPEGRRTGGQPGHERRQRPHLPPDHTEVLKPTQCRRCDHPLEGKAPPPLRPLAILRRKITEELDHLKGRAELLRSFALQSSQSTCSRHVRHPVNGYVLSAR